ncbi:Cenp-O kinetochore centromere component-domain-containing protein [Triangularia verruculosa]|uniref:Cenp-O kinetochore centromere component-domain-containing protein n=1 Tax=Triangularia verruculosa TaxID=2587418 RepID=A0AAN7AR41_9PEZI|nr:Cenp-O kinetochore centromere component-domain-containing protein [Triangularia verruculosa]
MSSPPPTSPQPPTLDDEISALQSKINSLKSTLALQTSTLLTAPSTLTLLSSDPKLTSQSALHASHLQQTLYRTCATLTLFRVQDPDPNAVDAGSVLGLRIEVVSRAKFLRPYYVLLNRPWTSFPSLSPAQKKWLQVHRHTVPACIPLGGLAARYLPAPDKKGNNTKRRKQDLAKFARGLRREVVRYHARLGTVADLRKAAGLGRGGGGNESGLVDISPADAEVKHVSVEWEDGRTGRLVMGDDGEIVKLVVVGENGRDREAGRELLGGLGNAGMVRAEEVVKRLAGMNGGG